MSETPVKFKRRKARNEFGHSHALTFSTYEKRRYLLDDRICKLVAKSINSASIKHNFAVLGFVFMPDQVHILIHPLGEQYDIGEILLAIKQGPSQKAKNRKWIDTVLWEAGGGFDSNICHPQERVNNINYIHQNPVREELVGESCQFRWSSANWFLTGDAADVECRHICEIWG